MLSRDNNERDTLATSDDNAETQVAPALNQQRQPASEHDLHEERADRYGCPKRRPLRPKDEAD